MMVCVSDSFVCLSMKFKSMCVFCVHVIRFFVVEDHILHATQGLVTRAFTDELWNMALSKIIAVLRTHSVGTHTRTHTANDHSLNDK